MCLQSTSALCDDEFTWQQLAEHNGSGGRRNLVAIRGVVYDVTDFARRHPGGKTMLHLAAGRDISTLFESYHLDHDAIKNAVLPKLKVGRLTSTEHPVYSEISPFYSTLKKRVKSTLQDSNYDTRHSSGIQVLRVLTIFSFVFLTYYYSLFAPSGTPWFLQCLAASLQGCCRALLGIHLMHDASHAALTKFPKLHLLFGFLGNDLLNGTSFYAWLHQHVLGHHCYTNTLSVDPDIEPLPLRTHPEHPWNPIHRWQWLWGPALYGLLSFSHRLSDVAFLRKGKWVSVRIAPPRRIDLTLFWVGKVGFYLYQCVLPLAIGVPWRAVLFAHFLSEYVGSFYLAISFQANHVVEEVDMISPHAEKAGDWASMQARTTQDYGGGGITFLLTGALNLQIVHHLLPGVSQLHYARLQPIVSQTLHEFGLPYNHKPSFVSAVASHIRHLRTMGRCM